MIGQLPVTMRVISLIILAILSTALAGCQSRPSPATSAPKPTAVVPPAAKTTWAGSYAQNIQPIFDQHCVSCHGASRAEQGLRMDSYDGVMKGTQYGTIVVPGSPTTSALESVIIGTGSPGIRMPHAGARLSAVEVENITLWIQAGAPRN